jgi:hypothetical protein
VVQLVRTHMTEPAPPPPPERKLERLAYGFAQPLWGLRTVWGKGELLGLALAPVLVVAVLCGVAAYSEARDQGPMRMATTFFVTFAALAPIPPFLFHRTYARISARIRNEMGLGPREPYLRSVFDAMWESLTLVFVLAIGVFPITAVLGWVPGAGAVWAGAVQALWSLHWIVVEAFDTARTLDPGQTVDQVEEEGAARPGWPWYARPYHHPMPFPIRLVLLPFRIFANIAAKLGRRWRPEVDRVETHPWVSVGFGLGTALLLAIPGVNLFFRPAVVIGAAHLSGRLDIAEKGAQPRLGPTGTQPFPTVG